MKKDRLSHVSDKKTLRLRSRPGSLTIEASFLVPLILFCMAAVMISGVRQGGIVAQDARTQRTEWIEARENIPDFPLLLRGGAEVQEWIGRFGHGG